MKGNIPSTHKTSIPIQPYKQSCNTIPGKLGPRDTIAKALRWPEKAIATGGYCTGIRG